MTEATPAAAPPTAPGLGELFEQSLLALGLAPSVFAAAALRPAPSFGAAAGLALVSGAAALAVNLAHGFASNPDLLQSFPLPLVAVVAAAAFGLYSSLILLLAILLYGLGRSLGGSGDFDRALQGAAAVSLLAPVQALCNWFPFVWALPAVLAAWVAAGALVGLFKTRPFPARAACAVLAGLALGLQYAGRAFSSRAGQTYAITRMTRADVQPQAPEPDGAPAAPAPAAAGTSGLDLLRGPAGESLAPEAAQPATPAAMMKDAAEIQQNASDMLGNLAPMLQSSAVNKNLSPAQQADMKTLQALMKDLQARMQPGAPRLSEAEQAKRMALIQQMTMHMMSSALQAPTGPKLGKEVKK